MRSPFVWWLKRLVRSFKHEFNTGWQFRLSVFVLPIVVTVMALFANNSALLQRFLQP
jgi:hypothetical protein